MSSGIPESFSKHGGEPGTPFLTAWEASWGNWGNTKSLMSGQKHWSQHRVRAGVEESVLIAFGEFPGKQ